MHFHARLHGGLDGLPSNGQQLAYKHVSCRTRPGCAGSARKFTIPFAAFGGTPYKVTIKMKAVNAQGVESTEATSGTVTVGSVRAPTDVTATPAVSSSSATVVVAFTAGDTTANRCAAARKAGCAGWDLLWPICPLLA